MRISNAKAYLGDQKDEGRMRIGDTDPRQIIQWISKAWITHELTIENPWQEFYRWRSFET